MTTTQGPDLNSQINHLNRLFLIDDPAGRFGGFVGEVDAEAATPPRTFVAWDLAGPCPQWFNIAPEQAEELRSALATPLHPLARTAADSARAKAALVYLAARVAHDALVAVRGDDLGTGFSAYLTTGGRHSGAMRAATMMLRDSGLAVRALLRLADGEWPDAELAERYLSEIPEADLGLPLGPDETVYGFLRRFASRWAAATHNIAPEDPDSLGAWVEPDDFAFLGVNLATDEINRVFPPAAAATLANFRRTEWTERLRARLDPAQPPPMDDRIGSDLQADLKHHRDLEHEVLEAARQAGVGRVSLALIQEVFRRKGPRMRPGTYEPLTGVPRQRLAEKAKNPQHPIGAGVKAREKYMGPRGAAEAPRAPEKKADRIDRGAQEVIDQLAEDLLHKGLDDAANALQVNWQHLCSQCDSGDKSAPEHRRALLDRVKGYHKLDECDRVRFQSEMIQLRDMIGATPTA